MSHQPRYKVYTEKDLKELYEKYDLKGLIIARDRYRKKLYTDQTDQDLVLYGIACELVNKLKIDPYFENQKKLEEKRQLGLIEKGNRIANKIIGEKNK